VNATWRRRILLFLAVVAALAILGFGFTRDQGREGTAASGGDAVEALIPAADSEVLSQNTIGVDLAPGYTGELSINGAAVPDDELADDRQTFQILYQPSDESALGTLPAGENCAQALIWPIAEGRESARTVSWCFNVT
jgi:hypothetical protein